MLRIQLDLMHSGQREKKIDSLGFREIDFERIQLHNQFGLNVNIWHWFQTKYLAVDI